MAENVSVKSMSIHYESKHPKVRFDPNLFEGTAKIDASIVVFKPPPSIKKKAKKDAKAARPVHKGGVAAKKKK